MGTDFYGGGAQEKQPERKRTGRGAPDANLRMGSGDTDGYGPLRTSTDKREVAGRVFCYRKSCTRGGSAGHDSGFSLAEISRQKHWRSPCHTEMVRGLQLCEMTPKPMPLSRPRVKGRVAPCEGPGASSRRARRDEAEYLRARKRARSGGVKGSAKPPKQNAHTRLVAKAVLWKTAARSRSGGSRIGQKIPHRQPAKP